MNASPKVHIYALSRLVNAPPANWIRELRALEEGKVRAFAYYQPLREAVVSYCSGQGRRPDEVIRRLEARARQVKAFERANPVRDNREAFDTFLRSFYPKIDVFKRSLLADTESCAFGKVTLTGSPHLLVTDSRGRERYVYLLASKWEVEETKAYLELLAVVVQKCYQSSADSLWCMDLRSGSEVKWKPSSRLRDKCERAADLYARFIQATSA